MKAIVEGLDLDIYNGLPNDIGVTITLGKLKDLFKGYQWACRHGYGVGDAGPEEHQVSL